MLKRLHEYLAPMKVACAILEVNVGKVEVDDAFCL
jgi:hypothetical protein